MRKSLIWKFWCWSCFKFYVGMPPVLPMWLVSFLLTYAGEYAYWDVEFADENKGDGGL
jgi:hypothetical protein